MMIIMIVMIKAEIAQFLANPNNLSSNSGIQNGGRQALSPCSFPLTSTHKP